MRIPVRERQNQRGLSLLSLIIAVPLVTVLLWTMGSLALSSLRSYNRLRAESELVSELNFAMERICRDLSYGEEIDVTAARLRIKTRQNTESPGYVTYTQDTVSPCKPVRRKGQPITGDSDNGRVVIKEFSYRQTGHRTVEVIIRGEISEHGLSYRLHTAVTCLNIKE